MRTYIKLVNAAVKFLYDMKKSIIREWIYGQNLINFARVVNTFSTI